MSPLPIADRRLCHDCVGEPGLKKIIQTVGKKIVCYYCNQDHHSLSLTAIAKEVEGAFERHFERTTDTDGDHPKGLPIIDAIAAALDVENDAAEDIQAILESRHWNEKRAEEFEECEFESGSYYLLKGSDAQFWHERWNSFEHILKEEARYFDKAASELLAAVFKDIDRMMTWVGKTVVTTAGPDSEYPVFYRARVFQDVGDLLNALKRPDIDLAPPPSKKSIPGRMNSAGIAMFYGATAPEIALGEVRPPVGSNVLVGAFSVIRPLRLLDLGALNLAMESGSIFEKQHAERLDRITFLKTLIQRLTKPVMPADEMLNYLPTQVVSDFLAAHPTLNLDGILFPSVQTGKKAGENGRNVALFHKASLVKRSDMPEGTEILVDSADYGIANQDDFYSVTVIPPTSKKESKPLTQREAIDMFYHDRYATQRTPTLSLELSSLVVHKITAVTVDSEKCEVTRSESKPSTAPAPIEKLPA